MIIAIDPGKSGGIAWGDPKTPTTANMPETLGDLVHLTRSMLGESNIAYLEKVGGYAGGPGAPGSAMFNFGRNYGHLEALLSSMELRLITPQKWQKALSLGTSNGRSKTEWKNHLKETAQRLYPNNKVTLATADALLIHHAATRGLI
jgi:hypothetical protein